MVLINKYYYNQIHFTIIENECLFTISLFHLSVLYSNDNQDDIKIHLRKHTLNIDIQNSNDAQRTLTQFTIRFQLSFEI